MQESRYGDEPRAYGGTASGVQGTPSEWEDDSRRGRKAPALVAAVGGAVGLAIAAFWRRRAMRKSRVERVREQAMKAAAVASERAALLSGTVSENLEQLDYRAKAGGGAGLAVLVGLAAIVRAWQQERMRRAEARRLADAAAAAARRRRFLSGRMRTDWIARRTGRLPEEVPTWVVVSGAALVAIAVLGAIGILRGGQVRPDWSATTSQQQNEPPAIY